MQQLAGVGFLLVLALQAYYKTLGKSDDRVGQHWAYLAQPCHVLTYAIYDSTVYDTPSLYYKPSLFTLVLCCYIGYSLGVHTLISLARSGESL